MAPDISEMAWRWRCKIQNLGTNGEKPLSAYSTKSKVSPNSSDPSKLDDDGDNNEIAKAKDDPLGSNLSVKTYYEGPSARKGSHDWVDYPPKQMSKSAAKANDRVAIKMFKIIDSDKPSINGRQPLTYHSIEIQNRSLIAAIAPILEKEIGHHLDVSEPAKFEKPFRPLYFCADAISAKYRSLPDPNPVKKYLLLLIKVMDEILDDIRTKKRTLQASGDLVTFHTAWAFFPRGCTVLCQEQDGSFEYLAEVVDTRYGQSREEECPVLVVMAKVVVFTGRTFSWWEQHIEIPAFSGHRPIRDLKKWSCPVEFVCGDNGESVQGIKRAMYDRGRKMLNYQGLAYRTYRGVGTHVNQRHNVDGRILIDFVGYNKHHLKQSGERESIIDRFYSPLISRDDEIFEKGGGKRRVKQKDGAALDYRRPTRTEQEKNKEMMLGLGETTLMYMWPLVKGYGLKNKLWLSLYIDDIHPMVWNDKAYDHLVYDEQQKDLVLSFVENHGNTSHQPIEDVIKGKGQGLILLLSGPPGTGKTLTAEAVADRTHRPLFYLQAEDLGSVSNPSALGSNLKRVFEMATEWNAIVLLDEADVFMAQRSSSSSSSSSDLARNELVSIFLRELEYFRGILFLTTNLSSTVDLAFQSRMNLHLKFDTLNQEARGKVWGRFLLPELEEEGGGGEKENKDTTRLRLREEISRWDLNGREIKNAARMVRLWCGYKGYEDGVTLERLENGIRVTSPHAVKEEKEGFVIGGSGE